MKKCMFYMQGISLKIFFFLQNYDAQADFERMKAAGIFQSVAQLEERAAEAAEE